MAREITGADPLTGASTFRSALQLSMPIALAGLGGLWSERAGVVNIGLEGMMILGTWFGAGGHRVRAVAGRAARHRSAAPSGGLLHAIATVSFGVDHIVSGVAINILGDGVTRFLTNIAFEGSDKASPSIPEVVSTFDVPGGRSAAENLGDQGVFFVSDAGRHRRGPHHRRVAAGRARDRRLPAHATGCCGARRSGCACGRSARTRRPPRRWA